MIFADSDSFDWSQQIVLVTGGTGSFGKKFTELMMSRYHPKKLIIFSRDEQKQHELRQVYPDHEGSPMRYFIGDVRDLSRLRMAMNDVDIVVHAAAMKIVPTCEYNPIEAVMTNVMGARNVIEAALDRGVKCVMAISTDKAVNPVNLYGATKLVAEKLFIQANAYSGLGPTRFSCIRYGNVIGSRGSVIPLFLKQRSNGKITITDSRMTRFWLTLEQGVLFAIHCIEQMRGEEVFVPKIPSMGILELAQTIAPACEIKQIGIRPGEKIHEVLISTDEARNALDLGDKFVIEPPTPMFPENSWRSDGNELPDGFQYTSDTNPRRLDGKSLLALIGEPVVGEPYVTIA